MGRISLACMHLAHTLRSRAHLSQMTWYALVTVFSSHVTLEKEANVSHVKERGLAYQRLGVVRGLYLRYCLRHSTTSLQCWHSPEMGLLTIFCVLALPLLWCHALRFWCAGGPLCADPVLPRFDDGLWSIATWRIVKCRAQQTVFLQMILACFSRKPSQRTP